LTTYNIEVDESTYRKFAECGKALDEPNASKCFELAVDALVEKLNKIVAIKSNKKFIEQCEDWMLHPSAFDESNAVFGPPSGMTEDEVYSLCAATIVWGGFPAVLTCWKPTFEQIDHMKETGRLWIATMGKGMVPITVCAKNPLNYPGIDLKG